MFLIRWFGNLLQHFLSLCPSWAWYILFIWGQDLLKCPWFLLGSQIHIVAYLKTTHWYYLVKDVEIWVGKGIGNMEELEKEKRWRRNIRGKVKGLDLITIQLKMTQTLKFGKVKINQIRFSVKTSLTVGEGFTSPSNYHGCSCFCLLPL